MRISSIGNVGIGTDIPGEKLEVNGNIRIDNGSTGNNQQGGQLKFDTGYGAAGCNKIDLHSNLYGIGINSGTIKYITNQKHEWRYSTTAGTDGTLGMTLDNGDLTVAGNLTVSGTTTTINTTNLTVDDKNIILANNNTDDTTAIGGGIILKGASDKSITWNNSTWTSNQNFTVESTGNTDLKITNSGTGRARLYLNTVNDEANDLFFNQNNSTHWSLSGRPSTQDYALRFYANNSNNWSTVMALQKDGNVGIGETSPSAKLDVNGGDSGPDVADLT